MSLQSEAARFPRTNASQARGLLRWLFRHLASSDAGRLVVETPSGGQYVHCGTEPGPEAHVAIASWKAVVRLIAGGDLGFAEAYRRGEWTSPDLIAFFAWATANEEALAGAWRGAPVPRLIDRLRHAGRRNSKAGSRRNISAHYDLGNDFYAAWLDAGMQYSSALFASDAATLEAAQAHKLTRVCEHLQLKQENRILEIGCGWGAFVERAAKMGADVTGITLSAEQLNYARNRLASTPVSGRAAVDLIDYRDVKGCFDGIVSIEMIEAVGELYWPMYFKKVHDLLRPGGRAVLQVITISEDRFDDYRTRPDFIQRYIFPGGMLPTKALMRRQAAQAGLTLAVTECFGASYAQTLAAWRQRFHAATPRLAQMDYDDRFRRVWDYYLAYCEAGFRFGALDVGFYVLTRDGVQPSEM